MNYKSFLGALSFILMTTFFSCQKTCNQVEKSDPTCISTREYDPVCACNGKTYSNPGVAYCNGITEYTKGECF
jgi:hypothetical protein